MRGGGFINKTGEERDRGSQSGVNLKAVAVLIGA